MTRALGREPVRAETSLDFGFTPSRGSSASNHVDRTRVFKDPRRPGWQALVKPACQSLSARYSLERTDREAGLTHAVGGYQNGREAGAATISPRAW